MNGESAESRKEIAWKQKRAEVDIIADKLGLGIDENIKEAVAAFRAHGFTTSASCEGHLEENQGHPFP